MLCFIQLDLCLMNLTVQSDQFHFSSSLVNLTTEAMFRSHAMFVFFCFGGGVEVGGVGGCHFIHFLLLSECVNKVNAVISEFSLFFHSQL